ncbi:MAG: hypothetical protein WA840_16675 [Caulobacteraceae bacterium]
MRLVILEETSGAQVAINLDAVQKLTVGRPQETIIWTASGSGGSVRVKGSLHEITQTIHAPRFQTSGRSADVPRACSRGRA